MMKLNRFYFIFALLYIHLSSATATDLGRITLFDSAQGTRSLVYEQIDGYAVVEGDILIGKLAVLSKPSALILSKIGGDLWPNGVVPFELSENLPLNNKLAALQAIVHWQQNTHVEFVELTSKNRDAYPDYISFVPANGTTCASYVGKQKGKQEINLSPRCNTMTTVHEIGHALGLWHEQSRADRDAYIRILWENIEEDHRYNFDQHINEGIDFGEYDYQSIMHYNAYAFSKNGRKTIVPLMDNIKIGQREQLSAKDIAAVNSMYPGEK